MFNNQGYKVVSTLKCSRCREDKPVTEYYKNIVSVTGYQSCCKSCKSELNKQYRVDNKEHIDELIKNWRTNNPGYHKKWYKRKVARQRAFDYGEWLKQDRSKKKLL